MVDRIRYTLFVLALMIAMVVGSGCGVDTAALAGSAAGVSAAVEENTGDQDAGNAENAGNAQAAPDARDGAEGSLADDAQGAGGESGLKYDYSEFLSSVPEWTGEPYCEINGNKPDFARDEIWTSTQESLDPLDSLGRCGTANSCIGVDGMPDKPRGNISEIHPSGWHSDKYDNVEGGNLYNRCHLIAHKLSGDDAVARNLITGTSYMNRQGMLPFEDQIEEYVKSTRNHVMYRVTPCFAGDELVARGVHMQAISVEDNGEGLAFNVYCFNVQPGIEIDYLTGDNRPASSGGQAKESGKTDDSARTEENTQKAGNPDNSGSAENDKSTGNSGNSGSAQADESTGNSGNSGNAETHTYVLNTNTKKFHCEKCNSVNQMKDKNKKVIEATRDEVIAMGYDPCGNCHP